jgi:ribonuclease-3
MSLGASAKTDPPLDIGHPFARPELLERALTHASATGGPGPSPRTNERLEFLGDRVLGLIVAEMLLKNFPGEDEGRIAMRHTALVRREALARVAQAIGLGAHMIMARGEESSGGRQNPSLLADCCEAVIAALYLDGGLTAAGHFIEVHWAPMLGETPDPPKDAKTRLQEWAQGSGLALPEYREIDRTGPHHAPIFTVEGSVVGYPALSATGPSKRAAEQNAAERLLEKVIHAAKD